MPARLPFVLLLCLFSLPARAIDRVILNLGTLAGSGWQARGVRLVLVLGPGAGPALQGTLRVGSLRLAGMERPLDGLVLACARLRLGPALDCQGRLRIRRLEGAALAARVHLHRGPDGDLRLRLQALRWHGNRGYLTLTLAAGRWRLSGRLRLPDLARLAGWLRQRGLPTGWTLGGHARGRIRLEGDRQGLRRLVLDGQAGDAAFASADGLRAGERLAARFRLQARRRPDGWHGDLDLTLDAGALYLDPLYLQAKQPLHLAASGRWVPRRGRLLLDRLNYRDPGALALEGRLRLALDGSGPRLESLVVDQARLRLPAAYARYAQPWLYGTLGGDLKTDGRLEAALAWKGGTLQRLSLQGRGLSLADGQGRFRFQGLELSGHWADDGRAHELGVGWRSAGLYRIPLGRTRLRFQARGNRFRILGQPKVPVFDGRLVINEGDLSAPGRPDMRFGFDAVLTPVSLARVTRAFGWPRLAGTLSGVIPHVRYADHRLALGGMLLAEAFDGDIRVSHLVVEDPFGTVPRLQADVDLSRLDLKVLTDTFAFGKIEGRLSGRVKGLRLVDWKPVAFDAWFGTPADDHSRHRISQRAVENLSRIGGGGLPAGLSRAFLSLFRDFSYARLGLGCRLEQGVCHMRGVADAKEGFYIVRGRMLPPRIDVIGYAREVDWSTLLDRIRAVVKTGAAARVE